MKENKNNSHQEMKSNEKNTSPVRTVITIPYAGACGNPVVIKRLCHDQMPRHKYEG
jgi:hypothetical protein